MRQLWVPEMDDDGVPADALPIALDKLSLRNGDILVIRFPLDMYDSTVSRICRNVHDAGVIPANVQDLIVRGDIEFEILRLCPGDVLMIRHPPDMRNVGLARMVEYIRSMEIIPDSVEMFAVCKDYSIERLGQDDMRRFGWERIRK